MGALKLKRSAAVALIPLSILTFIGGGRAGAAQGIRPLPGAPLAQGTLYRLFFRHLATLDAMAAKRDAAGKGSAWRTHEQRAAGLTDAEGQMLKQVAGDCTRAVAEVEGRLHAAVTALRARYPRAADLPPEERAELRTLEAERTRIVDAHVDRLRSSLGDAAFQKLDAYLHDRFAKALRQLPSGLSPQPIREPAAAAPGAPLGGGR